MKNSKTYLTITFLSILLTLYLFECYLIYNFTQPEVNKVKIKKIFEKVNNTKYDSRSKREIFENLSLINKNITVTVAPNKFNDSKKNIHFLSGISNSETIDCNENGYFSIYRSDRFGFNNPKDQWDSKNIGYILLGDSFAHGACVNRPYDITSQLRELSKSKALNLGYKANGPLSMLATLKEYFPKNVKNVVWLYFEGNDLTDLKLELNNVILKNYYLNANYLQNLRLKQELIDKKNKEIILKSIDLDDSIIDQANRNSRVKNKILKFIRLNETKKMFTSTYSKDLKENLPFEEFKKILFLAKKFTETKNSTFHFVYLPQFERYKSKASNNQYNLIKTMVNELNINFIDIHNGVFLKESDPLKLFPFEMWGHYNEIGYKKTASYIYKSINSWK